MAYFIKKTKRKDDLYLQIYESFNVPEKKGSRNKSVKALGYAKDLLKKLNDEGHNVATVEDVIKHYDRVADDMNAEGGREVGDKSATKYAGHFLPAALVREMKLDKVVKVMHNNRKFRFSPSDLFFNLAYAQILSPGSKLRAYEEVLPNLYGGSEATYDQVLDLVNLVGSDYEKYIELFNCGISDVFGKRKTSKVCFDCTNYYFEIDFEDDLRRKGPSKENRHCPIIGQSLMLDEEGIPIAMGLYPGNQSEKPELRKTIDELKERYEITGRIVQVADKGLNCAQNIFRAKADHDGYIFSKSVHGTALSKQEKEWVLLDDKMANAWTTVYDQTTGKVKYLCKSCVDLFEYAFDDEEGNHIKFKTKERRVVTYNPDLATKRIAEIDREVEKLRNNKGPKSVAREELGDRSKYLKVTKEAKNLSVFEINEDKVAEDKKYAGYNLLVTSEISMKPEEIYETYHRLWKIEESFRVMKTTLEARPVYVQKYESIFGHFTIVYAALVLLRLLEIKVFKNKFSAPELAKFMRGFTVTESDYSRFVNGMAKSRVLDHVKNLFGCRSVSKLWLNKKDLDRLFQIKLEH